MMSTLYFNRKLVFFKWAVGLVLTLLQGVPSTGLHAQTVTNESILQHMDSCLEHMDYSTVYKLYQRLKNERADGLSMLQADVTMMDMMKCTSQNRAFSTHYIQAKERQKRIEEDIKVLDSASVSKLNLTIIRMHLTASAYALQLLQIEEAVAEINSIDADGDVRKDKALLAEYYLVKGLIQTKLEQMDVAQPSVFTPAGQNKHDAFDWFLQSIMVARNNNLQHAELSAICQLAELCLQRNDKEWVNTPNGGRRMAYLLPRATLIDSINQNITPQAVVPEILADNVLKRATQNDFLDLTAQAYLVKGQVYFKREEFYRALTHFEQALGELNLHHRIFYPHNKTYLRSWSEGGDTASVDMKWIQADSVQTIPSLLAQVRERLSLTYAALNDKPKSDYNRNLYLDLLEITRQDRSAESRLQWMQQGNSRLTILLWCVISLAIIFVILAVYYVKKARRLSARHSTLLFDLSHRFAALASIQASEQDDASQESHLKKKQAHPKGIEHWTAKEQKLIERVEAPFIDWLKQNHSFYRMQAEQMELMCDNLSITQQQMAKAKRVNIEWRAKVSLVHTITPFIDRMLYVLEKARRTGMPLSHEDRDYLVELSCEIISCNQVLTNWINITRGDLALHVERFGLNELFQVVAGSAYLFKRKGVNYEVASTLLGVMADKALTFFMINTLVDNARKFTPAGGTVRVEAHEIPNHNGTQAMVRVQVSDTGCGISQHDIDMMLGQKVYDARCIGIQGGDEATKPKGFGFGIMNCKNIIETYRHAGAMFSSCKLDIQSEKGRGSVFSFTLPAAIVKVLVGVFTFHFFLSSARATAASVSADASQTPILTSNQADAWHESTLQAKKALSWADSLYWANVSGHYDEGLCAADSALKYINLECVQKGMPKLALMQNGMGELAWLRTGVKADYGLIMGLRNEIAVNALATHRWQLYECNNRQFTMLYKALTKDNNIGVYESKGREARTSMLSGIVLLVCIILSFIIYMYVTYFRHHIRFRYAMMDLLDGYVALSRIVSHTGVENDNRMLSALLEQVLSTLHEIGGITGAALLIEMHHDILQHSVEMKKLQALVYRGDIPVAQRCFIHEAMNEVVHKAAPVDMKEWQLKLYPLNVSIHETDAPLCLGCLAVHLPGDKEMHNEPLLHYLLGYLSILLYQAVVKADTENRDASRLEAELLRAKYEEDRLKVQNQILTGCLSAIKHETMYYPSRIKQLLSSEPISVDQVNELLELASYYRQIYTILTQQADRQVSAMVFKCEQVDVIASVQSACERMRKRLAGMVEHPVRLVFEPHAQQAGVHTDVHLLDILLQVITDEWMGRIKELHDSTGEDVDITVSVRKAGSLVEVALASSRVLYPAGQSQEWFQPHSDHLAFLLCKEIIRQADSLTHFAGARINASESGICFALPGVDAAVMK